MKTYRLSTLLVENKYFFSSFFVYLLLGGLYLATLHKGDDIWLLNRLHNPYSDFFFKYFTHFGDGIFAALVIIGLLWVRYASFLAGATALALTGILVQLLKKQVFADAYRPIKYMGDNVGLHLVEGVTVHTNHSFPSGHSATAFMLCCLLAFCTKNKTYGSLFVCLAILASLSRPYLVQHFFEDTYAGALIGVTITSLVWYMIENKAAIRDNPRWQRSLRKQAL